MNIKSNIRWTTLLALDHYAKKCVGKVALRKIEIAMRFLEEAKYGVVGDRVSVDDEIMNFDDSVVKTWRLALNSFQKSTNKYWKGECLVALKIFK